MSESIEVYFDDIENIILAELLLAEKEVKIAMGWITIDRYATRFLELLSRHVKLELILNDVVSNYHATLFEKLRNAGAEIKYIQMPHQYGHMHHKFCIIDRATILSGSYNWSRNAQTNFENIFVIRNQGVVVDKFLAEFELLKHMEIDRLRKLQNLYVCPHCTGQLVNILVFDRSIHKYNEALGDIIQVCTENPYDHSEIIERGIVNNAINQIADEVFYASQESANNDDEFILDDLAYEMSKKYESYSNTSGYAQSERNNVIHAWGKIHLYPTRHKREEDEEEYIKIYWKDKFVRGLIPDQYDSTLDVF